MRNLVIFQTKVMYFQPLNSFKYIGEKENERLEYSSYYSHNF